ncbi:aldo/keto reductase [Chloroflexota bacterium]
MEKIRLGRTNLMVSKLGFGGIPIQRISEDEAVAVIRKYLDHGVNFIDTANAYTDSEEKIGKAIAGRREGLIIATKTHALTREGIENDLQLSLKRLRVESIDLYQFHGINTFEDYEQVLRLFNVFEEFKNAGKIKHIGITSHQPEVAKEGVKSGKFETVMFQFNFINREAAEQLLPLCRENDVGFIAMKPFAGGMLDKASLALKYLLQFPDILPIIGIQSLHEIDEIIEILNGSWEVTDAEKNEMERMRIELGNRFCRRCDYCQPCSQGVSISMINIMPAILKSNHPEKVFSGQFTETLETAALCIKCGECEERCPYNLPIRDMIEEYYNLYQTEKKKYQASLLGR